MGNDLQHYGVLGMKWGVRKNPQRAYEKANAKMTKLDKKAVKKQVKAVKKRYSWFSSKERADRLQYRADKATYKAAMWYHKVSKVMGAKKASQMSHDNINMGKRYADWLLYGRR